MRTRGVRVAALAALVVMGLLIAFLVSRPVDQGALRVQSPLLGTTPSFATTTLSGSPFRLSSLRGHVVVLSFFASWCAQCQSEAPELVTYAWHAHRTRTGATILGVVYNDSDSAAATFARHNGFTFPVLTDPNGLVANDFAVTSPPVTIVLSPNGRVSSVLLGGVTASQLVRVTAAAQRQAA